MAKLRLSQLNAVNDPDFIERVKSAVGLPSDAELELQNVKQIAPGERFVSYSASYSLTLDSKEFGIIKGISVDGQTQIRLRFDPRGTLIESKLDPPVESHLRLMEDQIKKLVTANEIYVPAPGEKIDAKMLRARRKPWYVFTDEKGRKRLKRAYMA